MSGPSSLLGPRYLAKVDAQTWEAVAKIVGGAAPFVLALVGVMGGPGRQRRMLQHDVEMLAKLPAGSAAAVALLAHVEHQIDLICKQAGQRRDVASMAFALVLAPLTGWFAVSLAFRDEWYSKLFGAILAALSSVFVYGIFESASLAERDAKGRRIKK